VTPDRNAEESEVKDANAEGEYPNGVTQQRQEADNRPPWEWAVVVAGTGLGIAG
jgi:hypothetical protein